MPEVSEVTVTTDLAEATRDGLRRLAKAVVVITTRWKGERFAMAATAVNEVSMDPPSMLACINRSASIHAPIAAGADFCINILSADQQHISRICSGANKGEARFEVGQWGETMIGVPRLMDAQSVLVCLNERHHDYGTHTVFLGRVVEVYTSPVVDPLVYVDGRYSSVRPAAGESAAVAR